MKYLPSLAISIAVTAALTGCAVTETAGSAINKDLGDSSSLIDAKKKQSLSNIEFNSGLYLGDQEVKISKRSVPALFDRPFENMSITGTIGQITDKIASLTGLDISVTEDASNINGQSAAQGQGQANQVPAPTSGGANLPPPPPLTGMPNALQGGATGGSNSQLGSLITMRPYKGTLRGYLDSLASKAKLNWKVEGGKTVFFAVETRTFTINTLPGSLSSTVQVGASGGGTPSSSGSSGSSGNNNSTSSAASHTTTASSTIDPWASLQTSIGNMLSARGHVYPSQATNSFIVTDTPAVLDQIDKFLRDQNNQMVKRVDLFVKVYSVQLKKGDNYGVNWNTVYQWLSRSTNIAFSAGAQITGATNSLSFKILGGGPWAGSQAIFNALSSQGDVAELTTAHVSPMNNRAAPIFVGRQINYVQNSTTSQSTSSTATSFQQATVNTGFTLTLTPSIFDRNRIGLRYGMDISDLLSMKTVTSPDGTAVSETPEIQRRSMMEDTVIHNGETLVIAGFEQNHNDVTRSGIGSPRAWALGGSTAADTERNVLVIVISSYMH